MSLVPIFQEVWIPWSFPFLYHLAHSSESPGVPHSGSSPQATRSHTLGKLDVSLKVNIPSPLIFIFIPLPQPFPLSVSPLSPPLHSFALSHLMVFLSCLSCGMTSGHKIWRRAFLLEQFGFFPGTWRDLVSIIAFLIWVKLICHSSVLLTSSLPGFVLLSLFCETHGRRNWVIYFSFAGEERTQRWEDPGTSGLCFLISST